MLARVSFPSRHDSVKKPCNLAPRVLSTRRAFRRKEKSFAEGGVDLPRKKIGSTAET